MNEQIIAKFNQARKLFPHTDNVVYLNSASVGPFNINIKEALNKKIDIRLASDKNDTQSGFIDREYLSKAFASLIGAAPDEIGIGLNTSHGLNLAAFGLPLKAGDEVLVSDIEFPAIVYAFREAAKEKGYTLKFVKSKDRQFDIEELKKSISPKTKVIALSFVQFFNGYKNDMKQISEICGENNIYFVVDGIQGMGVESINVKELGIDIFTSGCHKWLLSPQGCGFFYVSSEIRNRLSQPFFSWLGCDWQLKFDDLFKYDLPVTQTSERFEFGYEAVLNLIAMKESIKIISDLGIENIQQHNHQLIDYLNDYIENNKFYRRTSTMEPKHRSSIYTFTCDNFELLQKKLGEKNIICVNREGSIRTSFHLYNNKTDVDRLIKMMDSFSTGS